MATVPNEQIVQRSHHAQVAITPTAEKGVEANTGEVFWASTTLGNTVTTDKAVAGNQADIDVVIARVDA